MQDHLTQLYTTCGNLMEDPRFHLSASVYTELTDVEAEINGWVTYDRMVSLLPTFLSWDTCCVEAVHVIRIFCRQVWVWCIRNYPDEQLLTDSLVPKPWDTKKREFFCLAQKMASLTAVQQVFFVFRSRRSIRRCFGRQMKDWLQDQGPLTRQEL